MRLCTERRFANWGRVICKRFVRLSLCRATSPAGSLLLADPADAASNRFAWFGSQGTSLAPSDLNDATLVSPFWQDRLEDATAVRHTASLPTSGGNGAVRLVH